MTEFKPWHIIHLDLSEEIHDLSAPEGNQGIYLTFWWRSLPLGHRWILRSELPLEKVQVLQLAIKVITPAVKTYLFEGGSTLPAQVPAHSSVQASDSNPIQEVLHPLKMCEALLRSDSVSDIPTSIVICTRDRTEALMRCLDSLSRLNNKPLEIIVVDNAPLSDETRCALIDMPGVTYVHEPRPGLDIARNAGVIRSSGQIVAFIDDDVTVDPEWLLSLQRAFQDREVVAVTGLVLTAELETEAQYLFEKYWSFNRGYRARIFDENFFNATERSGTPAWEIGAGANMAFRREAFASVGYFDERLDVGAAGCSGDSEFWYRILAEGHACRYEPTAVVRHYHRREMESFQNQMFNYMRGHVSALLVQFERYRHFGNLRRLCVSLPLYYMRLVRRSLFSDRARLSTVASEIGGCISGVGFYLRNMKLRTGRAGAVPVSEHTSLSPPENRENFRIEEPAEKPLVSVVIPCYNQSDYLGEAIQSVMNQTWTKYEVIVVDDGSTDRTGDVASRFPGVQYVRQDNKGLAGARNTGIRASKGSYLVFLDADDRLMPHALEEGLSCFGAHPESVFVYGSHRYISSDGSPYNQPEGDRMETHKWLGEIRTRDDYYGSLLYGNYIGMHATVMYRRDIFRKVKGFNESLHAAEDYEIYLRIARQYPIHYHDSVVAEYRMHGASMTKNPELMLRSVLSVLGGQKKYIESDPGYMKAYRAGRAFWLDYYGYDLIKRSKALLSQKSRRGKALYGLFKLLIHAPAWSLSYLKQVLQRGLRDLFFHPLPAAALSAQGPRAALSSHGQTDYGDLRVLKPFSNNHSGCRENPLCQYYTKRFLSRHAEKIRGRVLEAGDNGYAERYGGKAVKRVDMVYADGKMEQGMSDLDGISSDTYDCIILPLMLQNIYEIRPCLKKLYDVLKRGGVLLLTVPGSTRGRQSSEKCYWSFTTISVQRILEEIFPHSQISVSSSGNVLSSLACLHGMPVDELTIGELEASDPAYQIVVSAVAEKPL